MDVGLVGGQKLLSGAFLLPRDGPKFALFESSPEKQWSTICVTFEYSVGFVP